MTGKKGMLYGMLSAIATMAMDGFRSYNKSGLEVHPHQLTGDKRAAQLRVSRRGVRLVSNGDGLPRKPHRKTTSFNRDSFCVVVRKLKETVKPDRGPYTRKGRRVLPYQEDHARRLFKKARLLAKAQKRKQYKADCQLLREYGITDPAKRGSIVAM